MKSRIHVEHRGAAGTLAAMISRKLSLLNYTLTQTLIILCIGTDRSTGDALGPLTGTLLKKQENLPATIIGDIDQPVHASNLNLTINNIRENYYLPFIIAIDAGLGKKQSIGYIDVKKGPLKPGSGVNKELTRVGDMHITGLVNVGGYMEYMVLQSTRLSLVLKMAETIATAIGQSISSLAGEKTAID